MRRATLPALTSGTGVGTTKIERLARQARNLARLVARAEAALDAVEAAGLWSTADFDFFTLIDLIGEYDVAIDALWAAIDARPDEPVALAAEAA